MSKKRVLVLGAGPAGLAAGTRLLEAGGDRVSVKIAHQGHHLGGKAASYRDPNGRLVEHGWHMVLGFYDRMRALMRRAGANPDVVLQSMNGKSHSFETYNNKLNTLDSSGGRLATVFDFIFFDGIELVDTFALGRFMGQQYAYVGTDANLKVHDDICFRTYAHEAGLRPHLMKYSLFRLFREGFFNYPESISAYHILRTMQLMSDSDTAEAFVCRGGYSELIWDPIGKYFERLGGKIEPFTMATDWVWQGRTITGVKVGRPDSAGHNDGKSSWQASAIQVADGTASVVDDFDVVISTIPHAVFVRMNADNERMWSSPFFSRLRNIRSAATISMTVVTKQPVLPDMTGPMHGFAAPLGTVTNMKPYWTEYRDDPNVGAVLVFVGQENGFESWTDEQIIEHTFDAMRPAADLRKAGIQHVEIHRNKSDFERLMLCEPGVQQFRPGTHTPFRNLFLAGDWVANDIDLICMEGAIASGHAAADALLGSLS